ncbi:cyclic nucleotide-binding domain-containing protein [Pyxidicoccus caerfyrddinensis]|uniref:cyclic nucleotide-binding domain-containing protein n=1 Tax=Pyxidicoccus caerfyrddinensis TaxID=2709663 RepID=UPI001F0812C7|nr:cyclic nucleotide-binding domain-containing protein [Pyxidicoccus caerfyrddinensis]
MSRLAFQFMSLFGGPGAFIPRGPRDAETRPPALVTGIAGHAPLPVWMRFYSAGQVVLREGEPGDSMFVIVEGRVAVMRQPEGTAPRTVGYLSAGDFFGELALVTECRRTASIMAVEKTVVLELSRAGLEAAGARYGLEADAVRMACRERLLGDALRSSSLLASLPPELGMQLGSALVPRAAVAGEPLLTLGTPGDALYFLLRGRCTAFHTHEDGEITPYPDLEEGAVFGEVSLLRGRLATATVEAATPCTLLRLERDVFKKFFMGQPALRRALLRLGLDRVRRTVRLVVRTGPAISSY